MIIPRGCRQVDMALPFTQDNSAGAGLWPGVVFLGGIFAWMVSVPLFGPTWLALAPSAHVDPNGPIYLFLAGHVLGLAGAGLISDVWPTFRRAGLLTAAPLAFLLTLLTLLAPVAAPLTFPVLGLVAAWGIVAWAPAFRARVPVRRRALAFVGVPIAANAAKYLLTLGIGHVAAAWLVVIAALPLLASASVGPGLLGWTGDVLPAEAATRALPPVDLKPLWLLAPFLFVVYLAAGVTYAAVTPRLLAELHTPVDPSLLSYTLLIPLLALLGDRTTLRSVAFLGPLLLGAAFLVWAAAPDPGGAIAVQTLMGVGYAAMDLLTWVALLEIAPPHATATVFGIGLNMNVLPILVGAGLQARLPVLARLPAPTLAGGMLFLMLLAVVFFRDTPLLRRDRVAPAAASDGSEAPADAAGADMPLGPGPESDALQPRLRAVARPALSPRELEVACLVLRGHSLGDVARELVVSENTVKTHLASVYRKTATRGRAELAAKVLTGDAPPGDR